VFNVPLLLAIEANTQLKVGIGRKALFLYKKVEEQWHVAPPDVQRLQQVLVRPLGQWTQSGVMILGMRQQALGGSDCGMIAEQIITYVSLGLPFYEIRVKLRDFYFCCL
jgi:hypothetical protein